MHVAEGQTEVNMCREKYNMTPVEYVDSMGVFDVHSIAAHCVYLEDRDFDILKANPDNRSVFS